MHSFLLAVILLTPGTSPVAADRQAPAVASSTELAPIAAALPAAEPPASNRVRFDTLLTSVQYDSLGGSDDGGGASAMWLRTDEKSHLGLGLSTFSIGDTGWLLFNGSASRRLSDRVQVLGSLRTGPGERDQESFTYLLTTIGMIYTLLPKRLYLEVNNQYFDIDQSRGDLMQAGLTWVASDRISSALTYSKSVDGRDDIRYLSGRVDFAGAKRGLYAGFASGQTSRALLGALPDLSAIEQSMRQYFLGLRPAPGDSGIDMTVSYAHGDSLRRLSAVVGYRFSLRSRKGGRQSR